MDEPTIIIVIGQTTGFALIGLGVGFMRYRDQKLKARGVLYVAIGFTAKAISNFLAHEPIWASIDAGLVAWFLWVWWNNGGGDGMRRAFKKAWSKVIDCAPAPQAA